MLVLVLRVGALDGPNGTAPVGVDDERGRAPVEPQTETEEGRDSEE